MSSIVDKFEKSTQKEKLDMLRVWDIEYYEEDNPSISDEDYDSCLRSYNSKYKKKYTSSLGKANSIFEKYEHSTPVLSLDKITTKEAFDNIVSKFKYLVIEPKLDGLSVVYYPDGKIVSRGNGHTGEVLPFANKIPNLPKPLKDYPVRMEIVIEKDIYDKHFKNTGKNPRNVAAGILRRKEYSDDIKYLSYYAYNILGNHEYFEDEQLMKLYVAGFRIPQSIQVDLDNDKAIENCNKLYSFIERFASSQTYPTDGIVIKSKNVYPKDIHYTAHHPDNAIAFKFVSKEKHSILRSIEWSPGRNKFTPVAIFDAIELGGNSITRASLHNLNIMENLGVKIGSDVVVTLKNEIIPQIISSDGKGTNIVPPSKCPYCNSDLSINDTKELVCTNNKCELRVIDTMNKISSKDGLDIEGLSEKAIDKLRKYILETYPDEKDNAFKFLELSLEEIKKSGFSTLVSKKISTGINKKLENVHAANFLYSCNIPGLGINTSKDIMNKYNDLDDFINNWNDTGKDINGIGDVLFDSVKSNLDYIRESKKYIKSFSKKEFLLSKNKNESIVITGKLSHPKSYYEKLISAAGYIYSDSLTKETTYLVIPNKDFISSKTKKAQIYKTSILTEEKLMSLLNQ